MNQDDRRPGAPHRPAEEGGLAGAGEVDADADARMLAALERGLGEDLTDGATGFAGPAATTSPAAAPAGRGAAPPPAAVADHDAFAPPEADAPIDLGIDVDPGAMAVVRAPQAAGAVRRPSAVAMAPSRLAPRRRKPSLFARLVKTVLLLAVLGAAGLAGYRFLTLGYVWKPPTPPPVAVDVAVVPVDAELELDGEPLRAGTRLAQGARHVLTARAPGRLAVRVDLLVPAAPVKLALRLPTAIAPVPAAGIAVPAAPAGDAADAAVLADVDEAMTKLDQVARCTSRLDGPLIETTAAYRASTAGGIRADPAPTITALPGDVIEECRARVASARAAEPAMPALEGPAAALADTLTALDAIGRRLSSYYAKGEYKVDDLKLGKSSHAELLAAQDSLRAALGAIAGASAAERTRWQRLELEAMRAAGGDPRHLAARAVLLAARAVALAPRPVAADQAALLAAIEAARAAGVPEDLLGAAAAPSGDLRAWHDGLAVRFNGLVVAMGKPR